MAGGAGADAVIGLAGAVGTGCWEKSGAGMGNIAPAQMAAARL
jgi:hypothetical protein